MNKKAFSLIHVLIIMILLSTVLLMGLRYASLSRSFAKDFYIKEKAELFLKSSIETALLAISGYDRSKKSNCLEKIKIISKDRRFIADINISRYYLSKNSSLYCKKSSIIKSEESHGMVLLDITVTNNPANHKIKKTIKITKRTLQKI